MVDKYLMQQQRLNTSIQCEGKRWIIYFYPLSGRRLEPLLPSRRRLTVSRLRDFYVERMRCLGLRAICSGSLTMMSVYRRNLGWRKRKEPEWMYSWAKLFLTRNMYFCRHCGLVHKLLGYLGWAITSLMPNLLLNYTFNLALAYHINKLWKPEFLSSRLTSKDT